MEITKSSISYSAALIVGTAGLFLLVALYVFTALGLLSLGVIVFPAVLLGRAGVLVITTDLGELPLMMISGGILLVGAGTSLCIIPVCKASYELLKRFMKTLRIRRESELNEEDKTT